MALLLLLVAGCMDIRSVEVTSDGSSAQVYSCGTPSITGSGTTADPYLILNETHLVCMKDAAIGTEYRLDADLNLVSFSFTPISGFKGNLNGNGHSISNLRYFRATQDSAGFFSEISASSSIRDLTFVSPKIEGQNDVGVLAGKITGTGAGNPAVISNITLTTPSVSGQSRVSTLIGSANQTRVTNVVVDRASLTGVRGVGLLVGSSTSGLDVDQAQIHGVLSASMDVGGAVGGLTSGVLKNVAVYANLMVNANTFSVTNLSSPQTNIGGIVGTSDAATIEKFYFVGTINGTSASYESVGSIAGKATDTVFSQGYGAARSMTTSADATKKINGFVGNSVSGNTFNSTYYLYQAGFVSSSSNTGTVNVLTLANISQAQAAFTTFDFANIWKTAPAPFRMPVLAFQNETTPFLTAEYNTALTGQIMMTETEDASGRLFASQSENSIATSKTITFFNYHLSTLKFKSITTALGKSFTIDPNSSCLTLYKNQNLPLAALSGINPGFCQIVVKFLPRTDVSAELSDLLLVTYEYNNALEGRLIEAKVGYKVDGFGTSVLGVIADQSIQFNSVVSVTGSDARSITITNSGDEPISITDYVFESGFSAAFTSDVSGAGKCGLSTLQPSASCSIDVTFVPGGIGDYTKKLTINYAGTIHTETKSAVLTLNGSGL
jgi:hypothetical protein